MARSVPLLPQKYIDRFWSRVDRSPGHGPNGDCWPWIAGRSKDGFGKFFIVPEGAPKRSRDNKSQGRHLRAERIAYFLIANEDPGEHPIIQSCNFPPCCNGDHLSLGNAPSRFRSRPDGRRCVLIPNHPRAAVNGYVLNYVLIAERALGKPLPAGAPVHHVDGDCSNDANGNLVICQNSAYHRLLHARTRIVNADGNPDTQRICPRYMLLKLRVEIAPSGYCRPCARAKTEEWRLRRNQQTVTI